MIVVYLRDVGTEEDQCWIVCAKGDSGAVAFEGFPPEATTSALTPADGAPEPFKPHENCNCIMCIAEGGK